MPVRGRLLTIRSRFKFLRAFFPGPMRVTPLAGHPQQGHHSPSKQSQRATFLAPGCFLN